MIVKRKKKKIPNIKWRKQMKLNLTNHSKTKHKLNQTKRQMKGSYTQSLENPKSKKK
jgi:hypothetical protein